MIQTKSPAANDPTLSPLAAQTIPRDFFLYVLSPCPFVPDCQTKKETEAALTSVSYPHLWGNRSKTCHHDLGSAPAASPRVGGLAQT